MYPYKKHTKKYANVLYKDLKTAIQIRILFTGFLDTVVPYPVSHSTYKVVILKF